MLTTVDQKRITDVLADLPDKLVLSNLTDKTHLYRKTVIQKIILKGKAAYQIERFTDKQAFHENVDGHALTEVVLDSFPSIYSQLSIWRNGRQWNFKVTKKESCCLMYRSKTACHQNNRKTPINCQPQTALTQKESESPQRANH